VEEAGKAWRDGLGGRIREKEGVCCEIVVF
jgi:hypothetical protein